MTRQHKISRNSSLGKYAPLFGEGRGESNIKEVELIVEIQIRKKLILSITLPPHKSDEKYT